MSNRNCSCWPLPQPQQHRIRAASGTYTTAHSNAESLTHWARPGIESASSWMLVRFISAEPWQELLLCLSNCRFPPFPFLSLTVYLLKKPGHLFCRLSHSFEFGRIPLSKGLMWFKFNMRDNNPTGSGVFFYQKRQWAPDDQCFIHYFFKGCRRVLFHHSSAFNSWKAFTKRNAHLSTIWLTWINFYKLNRKSRSVLHSSPFLYTFWNDELHPFSIPQSDGFFLKSHRRFPCGSVVMKPTRIQEDAGSIPGPTQGVKDLALPWAVV